MDAPFVSPSTVAQLLKLPLSVAVVLQVGSGSTFGEGGDTEGRGNVSSANTVSTMTGSVPRNPTPIPEAVAHYA
jgi:hypothetical protein